MALFRYGKQMVMGLSKSQQHLRFGRLLSTCSNHLLSSHIHKIVDDDDNGWSSEDLFDKIPPLGGVFTDIFGKTDSTPPHADDAGGGGGDSDGGDGGFFTEVFGKTDSPPPGGGGGGGDGDGGGGGGGGNGGDGGDATDTAHRAKRANRADPAPERIRFRELLEKIKDVTEIFNDYCPEDEVNPHLQPDPMKPYSKDIPRDTISKLLYELARPAASPLSPPPPVEDKTIKWFVDNLPTKIIRFFEDKMAKMLEDKYSRALDRDISCSSCPESVSVIADVSGFDKYSLEIFVIGDLVILLGTSFYYLAPSPKRMVRLPHFRYLHHKVTACIIREPFSQAKLKIDFPRLDDSTVVNMPNVFQVNYVFEDTF